jgi:CBS domain-containing protein
MKAADVMVCSVISVRPNARVEEVASILLASRISAVPVIDEQGELLGIVSEGDLMGGPRQEPTGAVPGGWNILPANRCSPRNT